MPCFICKGRSEYYQRLDRSRARFLRKAYPEFEDSFYLCPKCFEKFERIFKSKKKAKPNSSAISVTSNASLKTVLSKASSKSTSSSESTAPLQFLSRSTADDSIDSTDRLVQKSTHIRSLRDTSKTTPHPDVAIAREAGLQAEQSALRRKRAREAETSPETPVSRRRIDLPDIDEDDESEIQSDFNTNDLVHVRPIVKRRKEPVVYLNPDVMDIYLANTSGG